MCSSSAPGLPVRPPKVRFVTWTLKFSRCHWVELLGLDVHYRRAEIEATLVLLAEHRVGGVPLAELLKRPEFGWGECVAALPNLAAVSRESATQLEHDIRYAGYLALERARIERQREVAQRLIPEGFDYASVRHLRAEAREQLTRIRPRTFGQAGRVSGITPADLALVLVRLSGAEPASPIPAAPGLSRSAPTHSQPRG